MKRVEWTVRTGAACCRGQPNGHQRNEAMNKGRMSLWIGEWSWASAFFSSFFNFIIEFDWFIECGKVGQHSIKFNQSSSSFNYCGLWAGRPSAAQQLHSISSTKKFHSALLAFSLSLLKKEERLKWIKGRVECDWMEGLLASKTHNPLLRN